MPSKFENRDDYIFNSTTKRWVKKSGAMGKRLIEDDSMDIIIPSTFIKEERREFKPQKSKKSLGKTIYYREIIIRED